MTIEEALSKLNVDDDNHWTTDGQARLDVVGALFGSAITRLELTSVAPEFSRKNPITATVEAAAETTEIDVVQVQADIDTSINELEEIEEELAAAQAIINKANKVKTTMLEKQDSLIRAKEGKKETLGDAIRAFQKSEQAERAKKVQANKVMKKILGEKMKDM